MERFIWFPCSGTKDSNPATPKGHVGEVRRETADSVYDLTDVWMTRKLAKSKYPDIIISSSHTRCPDCSAVIRAVAEAYFSSNSS